MATITIATGPKAANFRTMHRVEIEALWAERGLAVHRTFGGKGWTITHLRSGYAIANARLHRNAITVAKRLLDCGDWTEHRTKLTPHLLDRARQTISEAAMLGLLK